MIRPSMAAQIKRLEVALQSIAKNTCCDNCQEAKGVARAALASYIGLASDDEESGWLIEWPEDDNVPVRWWNPSTGWMRDANKAIRFSRESDATDYIATHKMVSGIRATEHAFVKVATLLTEEHSAAHPEVIVRSLAQNAGSWGVVTYQKLRAMPSSLNDACRTMDLAAGWIDDLVSALTDARNAIASLPAETLGYASDPMGLPVSWPIQAELIWRINLALECKRAADAEPADVAAPHSHKESAGPQEKAG